MLHLPYYLFRSIKILFHHSLIRLVVMHQLQQKNISWDAFIANEVFTTPPGHHQQDIPSSSHAPTSTSPSHLVVHTSPSTHIQPPHIDSSSSPFHNPSPSYHDAKASSSDRNIETFDTKIIDIEPFPLTYQRGYRHVFASHVVKGAMPSSSSK